MKLDLRGHTVLPGLINAHDHLEFNLFPALGRGPYRNATEWARDIYHPERRPVRDHLKVPLKVRLWWGGLKNLLSGVTTVCHHNPYRAEVFTGEFPVRVVRRFTWAHSLAFEPDLPKRLKQRRDDVPFVIHAGEGTDTTTRKELPQLDAIGALDRRTVVVHGVGASPALLKQRGASLIWCPTSNLRMLGRTLSRSTLSSDIPVALATDSALSAPVDLLDELEVARRFVPPGRLMDLVTTAPQRILQLPPTSDYIAMRNGQLALVVNRRRIRLISPDLARQLSPSARRRFQPIAVEGRAPVLVDAPVRALIRAAARYLGPDLRLAGRRVLT